MMTVIYISSLLTLLYVLLILAYYFGWINIQYFNAQIKVEEPKNLFSILIPARNEAHVISKCLEDILKQNYPRELFEVIVINDYSTDETSLAVETFNNKYPETKVRLMQMSDDRENRKHKKAAITFGIHHAINKYIILTDADCERGTEWLNVLNQFIDQTKAKMVYAPVAFKAVNIFQKIQALEFAGLVGIGAAAIQLKNPNMCSAANLVFEKSVFDEVEGYKGYDGIASGDDEFLMHKVFKRYPNDVRFLRNENSIVFTSANTSLHELADQRRRWVSKSTKYENRYITAILVGAYFFNASIIFNLIVNFEFGLIQLLAKTLAEGIFLWSVLSFFKKRKYLIFLPLAELFHIVYVIIIGIWANFGTYNWKGRNLK
jgi:cellulose synthase/poly-beta-1,6-N-acetylglucosamine synthase-like glycosyltransferase